MKGWIRNHYKFIIAVFAGGLVIIGAVSVINYVIVGTYERYIISADEADKKEIRVGIVFGAGVAPNGRPYKELATRLDGAAELYRKGIITKILVSGDNRFVNYNEPQAMQEYLTEQKHIPLDAIQQDNAGRSTYETCDRARQIFGLDTVLLITADSHLPRALFLCRKLGIESYGLAYGLNANNAARREYIARSKAMFNIYMIGEDTILGDPVALQ